MRDTWPKIFGHVSRTSSERRSAADVTVIAGSRCVFRVRGRRADVAGFPLGASRRAPPHRGDRFYGIGWLSFGITPRGGATPHWSLVFTVQNGATAEGTYYPVEDHRFGSHFHATLTGDQSIRITLDDGTVDFSGTADGTRMHVTVRGGSEDGRMMDFVPYDPY